MVSSAASSPPVVEVQTGWPERLAFWLILALVFCIPWENIVPLEGFGRVTKSVGVLAGGLWALHVLGKGEVRRPQLYHWLTLCFIAWNGLSLLWTVDAEATSAQVLTYAQTLVLVFLLWDLVDTPARRQAVLQTYVLGAFVSVYAQVNNFEAGLGFTARRFTAGDFHPNVLAFILALGLAAAAELAMTGGSVWLRIVNFAYVPLSFYGIALTGSRSGVACGLLGVGFLLVRVLRARPALRLALVPAALAVVALSFFSVPPRTAERVEGTREEDLSGRLQIWREGLQLFYRRPLLGVGSGAFQTAVNSGKPPHNFAISVLAELGIPGLLCYLGLLAVAAYHGLRGTQPLLWLALLSVCFITAMVHNVEDKKQTWLFLSLAVASQRPVARVVAGERRAVV